MNEEDRAFSPESLSHGHFPLHRFAVPLPRIEATVFTHLDLR